MYYDGIQEPVWINQNLQNTNYIFRENSGNPSGNYNIHPFIQSDNMIVISEKTESSGVLTGHNFNSF